MEGYQNMLELSSDHLLSPNIKLFKKIKIGLELVSLPHFHIVFEEKYFCYSLSALKIKILLVPVN